MGRSCGFTVIDGCPGDFICAPDISNLPVATDILRGDNQFGDRGWRRVRRKPKIIHSLFPDLGRICMGRKQDAIVSEKRADSICVSFEPCGLVLLVELFYFGNVSGGQGACCGGGNKGTREKDRGETTFYTDYGSSVFVWTDGVEER